MGGWNRDLNGVKFPDCCKYCVPPKRSSDCHATCKDYKDAKDQFNEKANAERAARKAFNDSVSVAFLLKKG